MGGVGEILLTHLYDFLHRADDISVQRMRPPPASRPEAREKRSGGTRRRGVSEVWSCRTDEVRLGRQPETPAWLAGLRARWRGAGKRASGAIMHFKCKFATSLPPGPSSHHLPLPASRQALRNRQRCLGGAIGATLRFLAGALGSRGRGGGHGGRSLQGHP